MRNILLILVFSVLLGLYTRELRKVSQYSEILSQQVELRAITESEDFIAGKKIPNTLLVSSGKETDLYTILDEREFTIFVIFSLDTCSLCRDEVLSSWIDSVGTTQASEIVKIVSNEEKSESQKLRFIEAEMRVYDSGGVSFADPEGVLQKTFNEEHPENPFALLVHRSGRIANVVKSSGLTVERSGIKFRGLIDVFGG